MPSWYEGLVEEARLAALTLLDRAEDLASPTLRLGITGLRAPARRCSPPP